MWSNARSALNKRAVHAALFGVVFALVAWIGYTLHFGMFALYDDEGYVLITLRDYGRHGGLYNQIFTQYGPVFYLFYDGLHRLFDFEWTNTTGRLITWFNWLGASTLCAWLVYRVSGWFVMAIFTFISVFAYLWVMIFEPMHPGSTITLWIAVMAVLGAETIRTGRLNWFGALGGGMGAALALVKINVGAFLIFAVALWLALATPLLRKREPRLGLLLFGAILPVALMRPLLGETWIQIFAVVSACGIIGTMMSAQISGGEYSASGRPWLWFVGSGLAVTVLATCGLLITGSSLSSIWQGVIVAPLKHPNVYSFPMDWHSGVTAVALGAVALLGLALNNPALTWIPRAIAWVRIVSCFALQFSLLPSFLPSMSVTNFCFGLPLAGIFAWPLLRDKTHAAARHTRAWLGLLLVLQCLHAFPVAGSQIGWGSFLWVPLAVLGLQEALVYLLGARAPLFNRVKTGAAICALGFAGCVVWFLGSISIRDRHSRERLEVPGAERIALPEQIASALRVVHENTRAHADVLFSLPGIYSLNLWADVPTPTLANATHWFSLLNETQQLAWIDSLESAKRPVFVVQHNILAVLIKTGFRPQSPVLDYVRENYHRAFAVEGYSFWVRNDRAIAPLSTGRLTTREGIGPSQFRLDLTVNARPGSIVAIELWNVQTAQWRVLTLTPENARLYLTPLRLDDSPAGEISPAAWPLTIDSLSRVGVEFTSPTALPPGGNLEAVLIGDEGKRLGVVRLLPENGFALPPFTPPDVGPPATN